EALRGAQAIVPAALAEPLPEGHFYLHDVIGLRVVTPEGEELGTITDVLRNPANDVYVVCSLLIPAVKEIRGPIDPAEGVLVVRSKDALATDEVPPEQRESSFEGTRRHGGHSELASAGGPGETRRGPRRMKIRAGRPNSRPEGDSSGTASP